MSSRIVLSTALAVACAASLHAQTPAASQANRTVPGTITVTGCVERADQIANTGTTPANGDVDSLTFMLVHAQNGPAADQPTGTSGTAGSTGTSSTTPVAKGSTYRLDGDVAALNPHVGHKVEVAGTLQAPTGPATENLEGQSPMSAPRLKVEHVKMVSETCAR